VAAYSVSYNVIRRSFKGSREPSDWRFGFVMRNANTAWLHLQFPPKIFKMLVILFGILQGNSKVAGLQTEAPHRYIKTHSL
jgi:hypothetical protein